MADDIQTSAAVDFRRAFVEAVADGEAPDLGLLRELAEADPWRYREAALFAADELRASGASFAAHALAAEQRDDLVAQAVLWRMAAQDAAEHELTWLGPAADEQLARLHDLGTRATTHVSAGVRAVMRALLVDAPVTAGGLAARLQRDELDGELGPSSFVDEGVARPALDWLVDVYGLYAGAELTLDVPVFLLYLADRDSAVATALAAGGAGSALRFKLAVAGQEVRSWVPAARGDVLVLGAGVQRARGGLTIMRGPLDRVVHVGGDRYRGEVDLFIADTGSFSLVRSPHGLTSPSIPPSPEDPPTALALEESTADAIRSAVPYVVVAAAGRDGDEPLVALGGREGEVGLWWLSSDRVERCMATHDGAVKRVVMGELAGPIVVSGGADGVLHVHRVHDGELLASIELGREVADLDMALVETRPLLAVTDADGAIEVWDLADIRPVSRPDPGAAPTSMARFVERNGAPALQVKSADGLDEIRRLSWVHIADEVPEYRSDATGRARFLPATADALGRETEANAIAEVITAASVEPPLAIGLFGEWGEGKSWFMERIWAHVDERTRQAQLAAASGATPVGCRHVRQVTFNAWHYAETDLWASLVTELFNQLGRTADGDELRRQARLRAELVRQTKVPQRLEETRNLLRSLDDRPVLPTYDGLSDDVRSSWAAAIGPRAEQAYSRLGLAASAFRGRAGGVRNVAWALVRARPWRTLLFALAALAVAALVVAAIVWTPAWLVAAIPTAIAVGQWARVAAGTARRAWGTLRTTVDAEVSKVETTRKVAQQEEQ